MSRFRHLAIALSAFVLPAVVNAQETPAPRQDTGALSRAALPADERRAASEPGTVEAARQPVDHALEGVTIGAIHVTGAPEIAQSQFAAAIAPYVGRTFSGADTQDLLSALSDVARKQGYVFATSRIPPQTLAAGVLTVEVAEGRIDAVRIEGSQRPGIARLLAPLAGRPARAEELDRLLMLASDFPGVTIGKVRYSLEDGRGVLIVPVSYDKVSGWASVDNRGSQALGPVRAQIGVDVAGLLAEDDRVTLQGVVTPTQPGELTVLYGRYAYTLPSAATEFALAATYGSTDSGGRWKSHDPHGHSIGVNASVSQALLRGRRNSLWATADFNYVSIDQWWDGLRSQRDRVATFGLSLNGYTPLAGGRLRAGAGLERALPILGASEPGDPLTSRAGAGSDYTVWRAWANWVGKVAGPVSARLAVTGQLASEPVLAIDQLTIGGPYFGRGYDFSERAGDKGLLASGELRSDAIDRNSGFLRWLQLYAFADAGFVRDLNDRYGTGDLYSAGAGARIKIAPDLRFELEAAFPINEPRYDAGDKSPRISATIGTQF
jgi:hemolysin activation/secretion protein